MPFRVIQWATGNVGRAAIEGIRAHPDLELAGVWVHSPHKAGRDAAELCGLPAKTGVAEPGIKTYLDLPLVAGRFEPRGG